VFQCRKSFLHSWRYVCQDNGQTNTNISENRICFYVKKKEKISWIDVQSKFCIVTQLILNFILLILYVDDESIYVFSKNMTAICIRYIYTFGRYLIYSHEQINIIRAYNIYARMHGTYI